jgi:DNA invertase Pin-like site-specific DNA recombinase
MSAYKGTNRSKGALGVFVRAIEDGQIEPGSYLLVESLDRLSRKEPYQALPQLLDLVKLGVVVVTLTDEKVYSAETLAGVDGTFVLMQSLVGMARAFEESDTKGRRVKAAWKNKFDKIKEGKQLTKRVPFWLNEDRTERPDRVAVVRRIFEEYEKGHGTTVITKGLNRDGVEPPSPKSKHWNESSVKKVLKSKAPVGTLVTTDGQEHEGYYPAVVAEGLWFACQLPRSSKGGARARAEEQPKPLAGWLQCRCVHGGSIVRVAKTGRTKKDGTRTMFESVACSRAKLGVAGCVYKSVPYAKVVAAIKRSIGEIRELADTTDNDEQIRNLDGYWDDLTARLQDSYERFKSVRTEQTRDEYQALATELKELEAERERLVEAVGTVGSAVMGKLMSEPKMTNAWLRKVFKKGVLDLIAERLALTLQNGKEVVMGLDYREDGLEAL